LEEEQILRRHLVVAESVDGEEVLVHHLLQVEFLEEVIFDEVFLDEVIFDQGFHRTLLSQHLVDGVDQHLGDHLDVSLEFGGLHWPVDVEEGVLHDFVHVQVLDVDFLDIFNSENLADDFVIVVECGRLCVGCEHFVHP